MLSSYLQSSVLEMKGGSKEGKEAGKEEGRERKRNGSYSETILE